MKKNSFLKGEDFSTTLSNLGIHKWKDQIKNNNIASLSTGSYFLNKTLEVGGWPQGKIIEIFGADSSGKSTLALHAIAVAQQEQKTCVYIDLENTLNPEWSKKINVDVEKLYVCRPDNGEEAFSTLNTLVQSNKIDLIIVDSVAAMVPKVEISNNIEDQTMGVHARLMSKGLRVLQSHLISSKTTIIFINQIREKINNSFLPSTTTTGGRALRYAASVRVEIRKCESIRWQEKIIGFATKATVVKNKFGAPMRSTMLGLYFDYGFDYVFEILNEAISKNIVLKNGSWFSYKKQNIAQGISASRDALYKNKTLFQELEKEVTETP